MSPSKKTYGVYVLTGLLAIAIFLHPSSGLNSLLHVSVFSSLPYLPYVGLAFAGILGWKLNQARILFVDAGSATGVTALYGAALKGHKDVAELFIEKGAEVNAKTERGGTPLYIAALKGHNDVVELLIEKGAEVNAGNIHGETPLYIAALKGHKDVVELLIEKGAEVNMKRRGGGTPLSAAASKGHKDVAELLIEKCAELDRLSSRPPALETILMRLMPMAMSGKK